MKTLGFEEACNLIYELPKHTIKHNFEESKEFLKLLGNPEEGMRVIHVAGTNGKGSVCAYMESILCCSGFHTGCFISPHLVDIRERIRIDKQMCSIEDFTEAVNVVKEVADRSFYPSFFEFLFFVGLLIFKKQNVDILILETGLGGRLDATNLIDNKELTVITSIGYDHMEYLGDTLELIAKEKAGIMRADTPVVFWEGDTSNLLEECAKEAKAQTYLLKKNRISQLFHKNTCIDFCLRYKYDNYICLNENTRAIYQVYNASLAVCALAIWDKDDRILEDMYKQGVSTCFWPGRMEEIEPRIIIDGAHNVPGTVEFLNSVKLDQSKRRMLIYGCMGDKQYGDEILLLTQSGLFEEYLAVDISYSRALAAEEVARQFGEVGVSCQIASNVSDAIARARTYVNLDEGNYVYIAGSLYLIGEVRGLLL